MKKRSFWELLVFWCVAYLIVYLINGAFLQSTLLQLAARASLGVILILHPVYPWQLGLKWKEDKCRLFIRVLGAVQIISCFFVRINF